MPKKKEYDAIPEVPVYELSSYEPVTITLPKVSVSDEQVEQRIQMMAEQMGGEFVPTGRKVVGPKEHIMLKIRVDKDGEEIKGLTSDERPYTLGDGLMPIEFDRAVIGMKVGETKDFTFNAPDFDDLENFAERPFHAVVTVLSVLKQLAPVVNDEWVKKYNPTCATVDEFKVQVRGMMEMEFKRALENEKNQRTAAALAQRFQGKIDDYWYETTRDDLIGQITAQAKQEGMDLEDWLGKNNIDQQQFNMMLLMQTREVLVQGFSLDAWCRHYELEPTDEDRAELAEMMAPKHGKEYLESLENSEDPRQKKGFEIAVRRYVANKDLTAKSTINQAE